MADESLIKEIKEYFLASSQDNRNKLEAHINNVLKQQEKKGVIGGSITGHELGNCFAEALRNTVERGWEDTKNLFHARGITLSL